MDPNDIESIVEYRSLETGIAEFSYNGSAFVHHRPSIVKAILKICRHDSSERERNERIKASWHIFVGLQGFNYMAMNIPNRNWRLLEVLDSVREVITVDPCALKPKGW